MVDFMRADESLAYDPDLLTREMRNLGTQISINAPQQSETSDDVDYAFYIKAVH
jgi:hypothetical protein